MRDLAPLGERLVAAATPRFKDFRVDFEKISNAASKTARENREGLVPDDAMAMFSDGDWVLRNPLQRRYAEVGKFDEISRYHANRFKNVLGRNAVWPDAPARYALDLFADHGRADAGVGLIRAYGDMQHKRLKRDYAKRNPRGPRKELDDGVKRAIGAIEKAIAGAIPDRKAELLKAMEAVAPYVECHGTADDRIWLDSLRHALWMEKRAQSPIARQ